MRSIIAAACLLPVWMTSAQASQEVVVIPAGSQPSATGSADNFTGAVRVDARFQAPAPARVGGGIVTFEASARTAWHTHPLGQRR
jgi:quercetin dioxygenase-like cupin family protein